MINTLIFFLLFSFEFFHSQCNCYRGVYEVDNKNFFEKLILKDNCTFIYYRKQKGLCLIRPTRLYGMYRINGDTLFLNSLPQRDKYIIRTSTSGKYKEERKRIEFHVTDKSGNHFLYDLYVISRNNDTILFKSQWARTTIKNVDIKGFYILVNGIKKVPFYLIKSSNAVYFDIIIETKRVMDNETWIFYGDSIIPRTEDGALKKYKLLKVK